MSVNYVHDIIHTSIHTIELLMPRVQVRNLAGLCHDGAVLALEIDAAASHCQIQRSIHFNAANYYYFVLWPV